MNRETLKEIEARWVDYLAKSDAERKVLFEQWWDKRDFWDMTKALREALEERDEARAEVERLREVVQQVHALAYKAIATDWHIGLTKETLTEIHKITKGMVE